MHDIIATLTNDGAFQTLLDLLQRADLLDRLNGAGPFTLFAPDNDAWQRVNVDELAGDPAELLTLLSYHLLDGRMSAADIGGEEHLYTQSGKSLTVHLEEGRQVIDNAKFVRADIVCSNGIIHVIDKVFLPKFSGWYCGSCC